MTRTRAAALTALRTAGYHDDDRSFARAYVESRVDFSVAMRARDEGKRMRAQGVRCDCFECRKVAVLQ